MENEVKWQAVKNNDAQFNGAFVYAVVTTKIYCKPSCASRRPSRENVRFFDCFDQAEAHGFRACRRCAPKSEKPNLQAENVIKACGILEQEDRISLEDLGAKLNLSPTYLQKLFKQLIGVSPKKYAAAKRLEKFKSELRNGSEVVDAMYESGFGSSSRLYENVSEKIGMTPAVYKKGGKNMKIEYAVTDSELGKILIAKTPKGICSVAFAYDEKTLFENLRKEFPQAQISKNDESLKNFIEAITANLTGTDKTLDLPLDIRATAFQMRVWETLRKISYGETVSYSDVAAKIGRPKSVRAVAAACASNRIALVIPCHRVVGKNGNLSGYRWGIERKKAILEKEKE